MKYSDEKICPECKGSGWLDLEETRECPVCEGTGYVENILYIGGDGVNED